MGGTIPWDNQLFVDASTEYFTPGCLVHAPVKYIDASVHIIRQTSHIRLDAGGKYTYKIDKTDLKATDLFNHNPDTDLNLKANEGLIAQKLKKRYAIIVNQYLLKRVGVENNETFNDFAFVVPIYSLTYSCDGTEHPKPFLTEKIKTALNNWDIPFVAPLPTDPPLSKESIIRFDRLQVVPKEWMRPKKCKLNEEALKWFEDYLNYSLTGKFQKEGYVWTGRELGK